MSGSKAVFVGTDVTTDPWSEATIHIALLPTRDALPLLDARTQNRIAEEFLPKLLLYRLRNVPKVQESIKSKVPSVPNADALQAWGVLDAPDFAQSVLPLLEAQREDLTSQQKFDPARAIVEVIWAPFHEKADLRPRKIADFDECVIAVSRGISGVQRGRSWLATATPGALSPARSRWHGFAPGPRK